MQKHQILEEGHSSLTKSTVSGNLVDEAMKTSGSSASSVRDNAVSLGSPFLYQDLRTAYRSVSGGRKRKPQEIPDYKDSRLLDDSELTLLGRFHKKQDYHTAQLYLSLLKGDYKITPYSAFTVPKNSGIGRRAILSPEPKDRIIFTAVLNKIKNKFDFLRELNIFGLGLGDDKDKAKNYFPLIIREAGKYKRYIKIDISDFFPSIDRTKLFKRLDRLNLDQGLYDIIEKSINITPSLRFHEDRKYFQGYFDGKGIPQGCAYSPLLANFYFSEIDFWLKKRNIVSFRYLDDILVLVNDPSEVDQVYNRVKDTAEKKLHLTLNDKKMKIGKTDEKFEFLGVEIFKGHLYIPDESKQDLVKHISSHIGPEIDAEMMPLVHRHIVDIICGWANYYSAVANSDYGQKRHKINDELTMLYLKLDPKSIPDYLVDKEVYLRSNEELVAKKKRK